MTQNSLPQVTRRTLLTGIGAAAGSSLLMSCRTESGPGTGPGPRASAAPVEPPTHVPFEGVTPDLPGTVDGVTAGFFTYPSPPVDRPGFPLPETTPITAMFQGESPTMSAGANPVVQQLRQQTGNQLEATTVLSTEYVSKFQTTIAGGDLPDLVQIEQVAELPGLLDKHFTDLTEFLAGDNIAEFPALAAFTADNWAVSTINGRIWGVPQPRPPAGRIMLTRGDTLAKLGIDRDPKLNDGEDFADMLAELTDPTDNTFAIAGDPANWLLRAVRQMCGAPNVWAEENGSFTHEIMAEETVEALEQTAKLVQAGFTHPEAFSKPGENHTWFRAGVTPLLIQGFTAWGNFSRSNPEFDTGHVELPQWTGGGPSKLYTSLAGYYAFIGIRKQDSPERVREILHVLDYIASPFGTTQYLDINYGVDGATYHMDGGEPSYLEEPAGAELLTGWPYAGAGSQNVLYAPGDQELVQRQHDYLSATLPQGRRNASIGRYSATALSKAATWDKRRNDLERSILLGEKPVSAWNTFAEDWNNAVGKKMAEEFAASAAV